MIYLDSNIFIFAILDAEDIGERCRNLLSKVKSKELIAATSCLTLDEVAWQIKKNKGFEYSIYAVESFLKIPNLVLLNVDKTVLLETVTIMKNYHLKPRDAIHAASCKLNNIPTMFSEDSDFDNIEWLERKTA